MKSTQRPDIQFDFARGLHGIGMEGDAFGAADGGNFLDGKDDTGFVVGEHDGDQCGVLSDGLMNLVYFQLTGPINWNPGHFASAFFEGLPKLDIGRVFHGSGDDVAFTGLGGQGTVKSSVVTFGAATGENNLSRIRVDQSGDLLAGGLDRLGHAVAKAVGTGGVPPLLGEIRQHGFHHLGGDPRGGVVVKIVDCFVVHVPLRHHRRLVDRGGTAS